MEKMRQILKRIETEQPNESRREDRMMKKLPGNGRKGFTLVELILASVILAMLIVTVGYFFTQMLSNSDIMDQRTRGLELCRQGIEQYRTIDVSSMTDGTYNLETIDEFERDITLSTPYTEYQDAKLVECEVRWQSASGPDTLSLSIIY